MEQLTIQTDYADDSDKQMTTEKDKKNLYTQRYRTSNRSTINEKARQNRLKVREARIRVRETYTDRPRVDGINAAAIKMYARSVALPTSEKSYELTKKDLIHEIFERFSDEFTEEEITQKILDYCDLLGVNIK